MQTRPCDERGLVLFSHRNRFFGRKIIEWKERGK